MKFEYTVSVEVERIQGKFASKDDISEVIEQALDEAQNDIDLVGLGSESSSEYEVTDWSVERTT